MRKKSKTRIETEKMSTDGAKVAEHIAQCNKDRVCPVCLEPGDGVLVIAYSPGIIYPPTNTRVCGSCMALELWHTDEKGKTFYYTEDVVKVIAKTISVDIHGAKRISEDQEIDINTTVQRVLNKKLNEINRMPDEYEIEDVVHEVVEKTKLSYSESNFRIRKLLNKKEEEDATNAEETK